MSYDLPMKRARTAKPLSLRELATLTASVRKTAPGLTAFEFDLAAIAKELKITVAAARKRFSFHELNDDRLGMQVMIAAKEANISLAYGNGPRKSKRAFDTLGRIGAVLSDAGFVCKDPQLGRKIDFASDVHAMREAYEGVKLGADVRADADLIALIQEQIEKQLK